MNAGLPRRAPEVPSDPDAPLWDAGCAAPHLTTAELARRWRMSPRTLERWRAQRQGPAWFRLHGRVLYPAGGVLAYEKARLERSTP